MPNFRHRLTRVQQRIYDRSNAIASIPLRGSPRLRAAVAALVGALHGGEPRQVERVTQMIADEITAALRVPRARIHVNGTRPLNTRGELHGLYTQPGDGRATATITLWMMTAKRGQVVAFKTFLRTLLHEICHHLDYALLRLGDSFHTDGFYKRESSLFYQVGGATAADGAAARTAESSVSATRPLTGRAAAFLRDTSASS